MALHSWSVITIARTGWKSKRCGRPLQVITRIRTQRVRLPKPSRLRGNFIWTCAGNFVYAVCQWGIIVILAKMGDAEMVGQFALSVAITSPIILFCNLNLRSVQAADSKLVYSIHDYLSLRLLTTMFFLLLVGGVVSVESFSWHTRLVIMLVGLAKGLESISDVLYGMFQRRHRMDVISKSMIFKGLCSVILLGVVIHFTNNLVWGMCALAGAWRYLC